MATQTLEILKAYAYGHSIEYIASIEGTNVGEVRKLILKHAELIRSIRSDLVSGGYIDE